MRLIQFPVPGMIAAGFALLCISGCGPAKAKVEGTVTFQQKVVVWGSVNLLSESGQVFQGQLQAGGNYVVEGLPHGTFRVAVFSREKRPPALPEDLPEDLPPEIAVKKKAMAAKVVDWFPIPDKYERVEESGLTVTVDRAEVRLDIELK